jgi:hypothetical protein
MTPGSAAYGPAFDMMMVPEAANMPPTPWKTEILAPGIWAGAVLRIWRTLSCKAYMPVHAGMHVGEAAAIGVERQLAAGGGVAVGDEGAGPAARHKAEVFKASEEVIKMSGSEPPIASALCLTIIREESLQIFRRSVE